MKQKKIRLGVNVDHIATLRQVRGGSTKYPDLFEHVKIAAKSGAEQITIHLREDRRHIQLHDLKLLSQKCPLPLNLEMAVNPQMIKLARKYKPAWACFVPEKRQELTTEGGLNVLAQKQKISAAVDKLQMYGTEISMFVEPDLKQVQACYEVGADAVELHTGKWVRLKGLAKKKEWQRLCIAANLAHELGMNVHAGHGLDYSSTKEILKLPFLEEVNIGHSIVCYSIESGLANVIKEFRRILKKAR